MSDDWKTLRVPIEAWERAKEQKETNGRTWGEQIVRPVEKNSGGDGIADAIETVENRTGRIERMLEELQR